MTFSEGFYACAENLNELKNDRKMTALCADVHLAEAAKEAFGGFRFADILTGDSMNERYREAIRILSGGDADHGRELIFPLCRHIARVIGASGDLKGLCSAISGRNAEASGKRISCLRGGFSDSAFDVFSDHLGKASVLYADSFADVCENLYLSRCDYAVLPVENTRDGMLGSFASLIEKYELSIVCATRIEQESDGSFTTFALLTKSISLPLGTGDLHVAFEMTGESALCGFAARAAEYSGGALTGMQSIGLSNDRCKMRCTVTLKNDDPAPFLCTVMLNVPGTELRGIYKEIQ